MYRRLEEERNTRTQTQTTTVTLLKAPSTYFKITMSLSFYITHHACCIAIVCLYVCVCETEYAQHRDRTIISKISSFLLLLFFFTLLYFASSSSSSSFSSVPFCTLCLFLLHLYKVDTHKALPTNSLAKWTNEWPKRENEQILFFPLFQPKLHMPKRSTRNFKHVFIQILLLLRFLFV